MLITETHKNFPCGSKGRLTVKSDAGEVLAVIMTPVQKARKYCEANPETPQGVEFARVMVVGQHSELQDAVDALVPVPAPPVLALAAIKTSRGNKYLNTCDDYRVALLAHFAQAGIDAAG